MNYRDCVMETTAVVGVIDAVLLGAVPGFLSFSGVGVVNGELVDYSIRHTTTNEFEVGQGTYNAGPNSITRGNISRSSNGGLIVNFTPGTKNVVITLSERLMNKLSDLSGGPGVLGIDTASGEPKLLALQGGTIAGGLIRVQGVPVFLPIEDADYEQLPPMPGNPGPPGTQGTTGASGPTGPAIFLEAEPGEDALSIPGPRGPTGTSGVTGAQGPIGPAVYLEAEPGEDTPYLPLPGPAGSAGAPGTTGATGPAGPAVYLEAEVGEDGIPGLQGVPGKNGVVSSSIQYSFDATNSVAPASGFMSVDTGSGVTVAQFNVSFTDRFGVNAKTLLDVMKNAGVTQKIRLTLYSEVDPTKWVRLTAISSNIVNSGGVVYDIAGTNQGSTLSGIFYQGEPVTLSFVIDGTTGSTGPTGPGIFLEAEVGEDGVGTGGMDIVTPFRQSFGTPPRYNQSLSNQGAGFTSDTYLIGSSIVVPIGSLQAGSRYHCIFNATKTGAGTATPIITIRFGTAGGTGDAALVTLTFQAQTAVIDAAVFEVWVNFRSVGSGTAAVVQALAQLRHQTASTGFSTANSPSQTGTSAGFDSTPNNSIIGISVNGGTSASWTVNLVQAELTNLD